MIVGVTPIDAIFTDWVSLDGVVFGSVAVTTSFEVKSPAGIVGLRMIDEIAGVPTDTTPSGHEAPVAVAAQLPPGAVPDTNFNPAGSVHVGGGVRRRQRGLR